jgi:rRNA maturation RNase YbeY
MTKTRRRPKLDLTITARAGRSYVSFLGKMVPLAHALLRSPLQELSIALVSDRQMSQLHDQFMGQPNPTDVLTFPLDRDGRGRALSGEIVICVPEARRQAKKRVIRPQHELLLYALHGMLHLLGLDDRTDADYRRIHQLEDRILTQLGVGPVFAPGKPRSPAQP